MPSWVYTFAGRPWPITISLSGPLRFHFWAHYLAVAFQSDELLLDDDEFGLEGGLHTKSPDLTYTRSSPPPPSPPTSSTSREEVFRSDSDSKIQFQLHHAFGDSDFSPAGTFSARLKTWNHGGQTLTKLRFSRNAFTERRRRSLQIRLPSSVLNPPGRDFVISSVKARCLPRDGLDEHFVIHTDGINILAVNYGSPGACPYPRQMKLPGKWSFNCHTVLKNSEQAPRAPVFAEEILGGELGEGEVVPPPERSLWAKYWMYLIPLGLIVMNAVTQAMNMAEEPGAGQPAGQAQQPAAVQRGSSSAVRRR
ncbi:ER membrane protein complex subunit 10 [Prunus yedoensis var. nudiflora]|uniref:ER membrane protein complex subunit 10 n=1 Tax=Prunus yedoensis var. nudiflora TaxID=2094558 RepID=A0A314YT34_PRUYE|nr:ER membrane protein complex subunit 10 [Prunus yedoensis var. nudiflora]